MIPVWDGKVESCERHLPKLEAATEYQGCGDTVDPTKMRGYPTKAEYSKLGTTGKAEEKKVLYDSNKQMCAVVVLGQETDCRMAPLGKTNVTV